MPSWVDKVERGVRTLDRFSVIQELAEVLRVDPAALLGRASPASSRNSTTMDGVEAVRAALARYDAIPHSPGQSLPRSDELARRVGHAWMTYQHAHYPQLLKLLPDLLTDAQRANTNQPAQMAGLLVQVYRVTSSVLVKLGEADLAWLAADRAVTAAGGGRLLAAVAAIPLGQALRALDRGRLAMAATIPAAHRITSPTGQDGTPEETSVLGALLLQAALAAAESADPHSAYELTDQADDLASRIRDDHDDPHWTGFGPSAVELARVTTAIALGDIAEAITRHEQTIRRKQWSRLPAEQRAAHLIDAARAYLQVGDVAAAGRALVDADRTAPAETRSRPAARTVIATVARRGPVAPDVAALATTLGLV